MSSKRHLRRSRCERKIKYRTAGEARSAARKFVEMGGDQLFPYRCEYGSHFHLGHAPYRVEVAKASKQAAFKIRQKIDNAA